MAQDLNVGCSSLEVEIPEKNENDWKEGKWEQYSVLETSGTNRPETTRHIPGVKWSAAEAENSHLAVRLRRESLRKS